MTSDELLRDIENIIASLDYWPELLAAYGEMVKEVEDMAKLLLERDREIKTLIAINRKNIK